MKNKKHETLIKAIPNKGFSGNLKINTSNKNKLK